ncbi:hypothetical protein TNCV_73971 [Trichonephila clavipes]|nr:hypothetical protein TNCV_73971 [Trichonephila clavipes]
MHEETGLQRNGTFSDESGFNLSSDENRVRVWRPCGKRLSPAFALQRHTASTAGVMKLRLESCLASLSLMSFGQRHERPSNRTMKTYWAVLANIWQVIPVERFYNLVESMPRRVAGIIKAR